MLESLVTHVLLGLLDGFHALPIHDCTYVDFTQVELLGAVPQLVDFAQLSKS